jgi:cell division protein FtsB
VGSLFVGLFIAWILYVARSVSSTLTIYGKNHVVKKAQRTVADLEHRVHELEAENAQLRTGRPPVSEAPVRTVRPDRSEKRFFSWPLFKRTGE